MSDKTPRYLSLVTFVDEETQKHYEYAFKHEWRFVFLGEIVQMPGHCVVASHDTGKIFSGFHTENFREMTDDEC